MPGPIRSLLTAAVAALIRLYQVAISPLFPSNCRFQPTCSEYTLQAVRLHGSARGLWLGAKRIGKCHPFHPGGYDPVEDPKPKTEDRHRRHAGCAHRTPVAHADHEHSM